ncbi:MAG: hypothetical protein FWE63_08110 [Bacteroidales bacterium]|nr:hypothetical protein [Bacteroidales bacterium]
MKKILKIFLLLCIALPAYCQVENVENIMTRRYLSCSDIVYNVSWLMPEFYEKGNMDTLQAILDFWEKRCGMSEAVMRSKIIFSISSGSFSENLYGNFIDSSVFVHPTDKFANNRILRLLRSYEWSNTTFNVRRGYWDHWDDWGNDISRIQQLNGFTVNLSKKLLETKELSVIERFFLLFYSNEFKQAWQMLDSDELDGTRLKELYLQEKKTREQDVSFHNNWMVGAWIPQGNLELLGVHPFFGYRLGGKAKKLTINLSFGLKFGNSPNIYQIYKDDSIWNTNRFFGIYLGSDINRELFRFGRHGIDIIGGVAWENINTLNEKKEHACGCTSHNDNDRIKHNLNSLNLNIGLGYKFYFKKQQFNQRYIGLDVKYNFVNFKNTHGTNLDGNILTVNLILGNILW